MQSIGTLRDKLDKLIDTYERNGQHIERIQLYATRAELVKLSGNDELRYRDRQLVPVSRAAKQRGDAEQQQRV